MRKPTQISLRLFPALVAADLAASSCSSCFFLSCSFLSCSLFQLSSALAFRSLISLLAQPGGFGTHRPYPFMSACPGQLSKKHPDQWSFMCSFQSCKLKSQLSFIRGGTVLMAYLVSSGTTTGSGDGGGVASGSGTDTGSGLGVTSSILVALDAGLGLWVGDFFASSQSEALCPGFRQ